MYQFTQIKPDLYYIGTNQRTGFQFENLYPVEKGISYNSYLLMDEKTVLLDTVDKITEKEFLNNLSAVLKSRTLDYLIVNHMEPDHCSCIPSLIQKYPEMQIVGNVKTFQMIEQFFQLDISHRKYIVKEGDTLSTGTHNLSFYFAPMIHWPEVMVTYDSTAKTLFSADAFGTFGALQGHLYADQYDFKQEYLDEARRYYTNIVGKYGVQVNNLLKKASNLDIQMICPLHGPIIRKDLNLYIDQYATWASYTPEDEGVVIIYASIYGNTEQAIDLLARKLSEKGMKHIAIHNVSSTHFSYLISDCFRYKNIVLASPTYNGELFPYMDLFLTEFKAHNIQNRSIATIDNGTWASMCNKHIKEKLSTLKNTYFYENVISIKSAATQDNVVALEELAETLCQ